MSPAIRKDAETLEHWPKPGADAESLCARLIERVRAEIATSGGSISFARYMQLALYEPGLGYYSNGLIKFGSQGDFVTAPEISPLFGRCLARQCRDVLDGLGGGDVLELGAGTGRLAADLLLELERLGALPRRYLVLDLSADLRTRQREHLRSVAAHLLPRVAWLDELPEGPLEGLILANEVLDAMPVHRFRLGDGIRELRVTWQEDRFTWTDQGPSAPEVVSAVERVQAGLGYRFPRLYSSEISLMIEPWIASLAERLDRGVILGIDYGYPRREYYHPERSEGTLMCHYRQRAHADPFVLPGLQDLTAFVDFTAVAEAGAANELDLAGYTTQAHFLMACGLDTLLTELNSQEPQHYLEYARQAKTLTLPGEMGERFKVMALAKGWGAPLRGFELFDYRGRL